MATRTRNKPSSTLGSTYNLFNRFYRNNSWTPIPPWPSAYADGSLVSRRLTSEEGSITDTIGIGFGRAEKPCTHYKWKASWSDTKVPYEHIPSSGWCYKGLVPLPVSCVCYDNRAHASGFPVGLTSLAIARIPAFAPEEAQGFVSYLEMAEIGDSIALSTARSLALCLWSAYRGRLSQSRRHAETLRKKISKTLSRGPKDDPGHIKQLIDMTQDIVSYDMEWKFGWKPLLAEMQAITKVAQDIDKINARLTKGVRVYGKARERKTTSGSSSYGISNTPVTMTGRSEWQQQTQFTAVASVVRKLRPEFVQVENTLRNLRIFTDVAGLTPSLKRGWQFLPLSFVVDFFWPVSQLLESMQGLQTPLSSHFLTTSPILTTISQTTASGSLTWKPLAPTTGGGSGSWSSERSDYNRTIPASLAGVPTMYIPPTRLPDRAGKVVSMCEIAFQRLVGRVR